MPTRFNIETLREIKALEVDTNFIHVNPLPVWPWLICEQDSYNLAE